MYHLGDTVYIGTHKYEGQWGILDQIIVSEPLLGKDYSTYKFLRYKVFNADFLKQKDDPTGRAYDRQAMFYRADWQHRLTPKGEVEAQRAGDFLLNEGLLGGSNSNSVGQTGYYTSPYVRATETAGFLTPKAHWHTEEWLAERDWGAYGAKMSALRGEDFPYDNCPMALNPSTMETTHSSMKMIQITLSPLNKRLSSSIFFLFLRRRLTLRDDEVYFITTPARRL